MVLLRVISLTISFFLSSGLFIVFVNPRDIISSTTTLKKRIIRDMVIHWELQLFQPFLAMTYTIKTQKYMTLTL